MEPSTRAFLNQLAHSLISQPTKALGSRWCWLGPLLNSPQLCLPLLVVGHSGADGLGQRILCAPSSSCQQTSPQQTSLPHIHIHLHILFQAPLCGLTCHPSLFLERHLVVIFMLAMPLQPRAACMPLLKQLGLLLLCLLEPLGLETQLPTTLALASEDKSMSVLSWVLWLYFSSFLKLITQ